MFLAHTIISIWHRNEMVFKQEREREREKMNLQNAMAETTFTICAIIRLLIPAEFSFSWAWCEIECTEATHVFIRCRGRVWTVSRFISMFNCHFLSVTSIAYCYVDRTTSIQSVVIYSIWPLIGMNLIMNVQPPSETMLLEYRDNLEILVDSSNGILIIR